MVFFYYLFTMHTYLHTLNDCIPNILSRLFEKIRLYIPSFNIFCRGAHNFPTFTNQSGSYTAGTNVDSYEICHREYSTSNQLNGTSQENNSETTHNPVLKVSSRSSRLVILISNIINSDYYLYVFV